MSSKRKVLLAPRPRVAPRTHPAETPTEGTAEPPNDDDAADELEGDRPLTNRRSGGGGFGPAIAGIMHGIDADIFRDPAAIQRMQRDSGAVVKTADGTVIGIELPGEGTLEVPGPDPDADPGPEAKTGG